MTIAAVGGPFLVDKQSQQGYGALVGIGLPFPMLIAFVAGIYLTVNSRHRPLVVLFLITILFFVVTFGAVVSDSDSDAVSDKAEQAMDTATWLYAVVATLVHVWWFTVGRWRYRNEPLIEP